jgi:hypothetical protein
MAGPAATIKLSFRKLNSISSASTHEECRLFERIGAGNNRCDNKLGFTKRKFSGAKKAAAYLPAVEKNVSLGKRNENPRNSSSGEVT